MRTDEVDADLERLGDVLWVSDHVHHWDTGFVELDDTTVTHQTSEGLLGVLKVEVPYLFDNFLWRDSDGADEQCHFLVNDHVDELAQVSFGVIVL